MTKLPRGVRSVSERIVKDGRALIVTSEEYEDYDFNDLPDGTLHVDTETGVVTAKLKGESAWQPTSLTYDKAVINGKTVNVQNPTLVTARDSVFLEENFVVKSIDTEHNIFVYEIVETGVEETERRKKQGLVSDDGDEFVFELEKGDYGSGRNHLFVSVDGVLERTVENGGIKEVSNKRFAVLDKLVEEQVITVKYIKWARVGNPYPRFFLTENEPELPLNGDFWLVDDDKLEETIGGGNGSANNNTISWSRITGKPRSLAGYGIEDDIALNPHTHSMTDILGLKSFVEKLDNIDNLDAKTIQGKKPGKNAGDLVYLGDDGKIDSSLMPKTGVDISDIVKISATRPTKNLSAGLMWVCQDGTGYRLEIYDGTKWITIGGNGVDLYEY